MGVGLPELVYQDIGNWKVEEAKRDNPHQTMFAKAGSKRRTTVTREALIKDGPEWWDGRQTSWFVAYGDLPGDVELVAVHSATELANLPSGALPLQEFANLAAAESPGLADELFAFLAVEAEPYTAHHTTGADIGRRLHAVFQLAQLENLTYQDSLIGQGITIPPVVHRPRDPATIVGADGVEW